MGLRLTLLGKMEWPVTHPLVPVFVASVPHHHVDYVTNRNSHQVKK